MHHPPLMPNANHCSTAWAERTLSLTHLKVKKVDVATDVAIIVGPGVELWLEVGGLNSSRPGANRMLCQSGAGQIL